MKTDLRLKNRATIKPDTEINITAADIIPKLYKPASAISRASELTINPLILAVIFFEPVNNFV